MLHSETQRTTKFCVEGTEPPTKESMQENGTERKMVTHEWIGIDYTQMNLRGEIRRQFLDIRTIMFCNISQTGESEGQKPPGVT